MLETIIVGIAGICIAGIGYLLKKAKVSKEMTDLITSALERFVIERAITSVEAWAEKKLKATGEKIMGDEKLKMAVEEIKSDLKKLAAWGIKLDISLDDEELKARVKQVFDDIEDKLHRLYVGG
ncbi:hypothetical protein H5T87_05415 [bacterium]|nr:hypothetical protein [bacterium]